MLALFIILHVNSLILIWKFIRDIFPFFHLGFNLAPPIFYCLRIYKWILWIDKMICMFDGFVIVSTFFQRIIGWSEQATIFANSFDLLNSTFWLIEVLFFPVFFFNSFYIFSLNFEMLESIKKANLAAFLRAFLKRGMVLDYLKLALTK